MMPLISDSLKASLVEQLGMEKHNASSYLYIAAFLHGKGLHKLAKHFEQQHDEEQQHSLMIYRLLTDLGETFAMPDVTGCSVPFETIIDIAELYMATEFTTTESLDEIKHQSVDENCPVVEEVMRKMIALQQNEYAEATDFQDKAELTGGDWKFVLLWNNSLGD